MSHLAGRVFLFLIALHSFAFAEAATEFMQKLHEVGWEKHVGTKVAIWVSVPRQKLFLIQNTRLIKSYPCSTSYVGTGNKEGSLRTPLGWHVIAERIGENKPWGAIFKARHYTNEVWDPAKALQPDEDLILTRILWLKGCESGINQGMGIDSHDRFIYIHGTQDESSIGRPTSHGCIRLKNDDILSLFEHTYSSMPVLITDW